MALTLTWKCLCSGSRRPMRSSEWAPLFRPSSIVTHQDQIDPCGAAGTENKVLGEVSVATAVATRLPRPSLTLLDMFSKHAEVGAAVISATVEIDLVLIVAA